MTPPSPSLWSELKRRKVVRAGVWYALAAAAMLEVLDVVVPALRLPDWTMTLLVVLALAGLPIVLVMAWVFDLTSEGLRRDASATETAASETPETPTPATEPDRASADGPVRKGGEPIKVAVFFAILLVALAGWSVWETSSSERAEPTASRGSVAVLPFSVQGSGEVQLLEEGLVDLLSTKLDAGTLLRATDPRALFAVLDGLPTDATDEERAAAVVEQLGASAYVVGRVVAFGDRLQVRASLYHAAEDSAITATVEGPADALFDLVDRLAAELLVGETGDELGRIAGLTTSSLPALKAYLRGERAIRDGRFDAAMDEFQAAIRADSTFALAYYKYSLAGEWAGRGDVLDLADAAPYVERLNPRIRDLVRASIAWRAGQAGEAERLYRSVLARYPDDVEAWFQLGEIRFHSGPLQGDPLRTARRPWEKVLELEPSNPFALLHLTRIAGAEYQADEVAKYVERIRAATEPGDQRRLEATGVLAGLSGDAALREAFLGHVARESNLGIRAALWYGISFSRDLSLSRRIGRIGTDESRPTFIRNVARIALAHLDVSAGDPRPVLERLDSVAITHPDLANSYAGLLATLPFLPAQPDFLERVRTRLEAWNPSERGSDWATFSVHNGDYPAIKPYLLGLLSVTTGDLTAADQAMIALEERVRARGGVGLGPDLVRGLRARILHARGEPAQALEALAPMRLDTVPYHLALNSAFIARTNERFLRGELLHELGRQDEALRAYESVIDQSPLSIAFLAPTHLRRGEIHEARGEGRLASEQYARFLDLWRDPAPEHQPLVDDVRTRLERLTAEPAA